MLSDRLEELHTTKLRHDPEENDVVYFSAQEETMMKAIQTLGSVKVSSAYAALSCVVGGLKRVPHGKRSSFTVNTRFVFSNKAIPNRNGCYFLKSAFATKFSLF